MGPAIDKLLTSRQVWRAVGFKSKNAWSWFLDGHPEIVGLRHKIGGLYLWPSDVVAKILELRGGTLKGGGR